MPFTVACPGCRAPYAVKDEHRGLSLRCVRCQRVFPAIPETQPAPPVMAAPPTPPPPAPPAPPAPSTIQSSLPPPPTPPANGDPFADIDADPATGPRPSRKSSGPSFGQRVSAAGQTLAPLGRRLLALPRKVQIGIAAGVMLMGLVFVAGVVWAFSSKGSSGAVAVADTKSDKPTPEPGKPALTGTEEITEEAQNKVKKATVHITILNNGVKLGSGSGFFAIERGVILTNAHVLGMKEEHSGPPSVVEVVLNSGEKDEKKINGVIVGVDRENDLAVLQARGWTGTLPTPLEVRPAAGLKTRQKVWVFGFPLSTQLGKEMRVSGAHVAALRKKKDSDALGYVDMDSTMQPGNSGGPVVDANGDVTCVAVAGIRGTSINFAVPGEYVRALLNGTCSSAAVGQAYTSNGKLLVPISVVKTDPLRKMSEVAVEVWAGQKGPPRAATTSTPPAMPADTPHAKTVLARKEGDALSEDVALPTLPKGLVYWVQPRWTDAAGQARWGPGVIWEMKSEPVERKAAELAIKHVEGDRPVSLHWQRSMKTREDDEEESLSFGFKAELTETTRGVDAQGAARVHLQYRSFEQLANGRSLRTSDARNIETVTTDMRVDPRGRIVRHDSDFRGVPPGARAKVSATQNHVIRSLIAVTVPISKGKTNPLATWKEQFHLSMLNPGEDTDDNSLEATWTYLGTRTRNGREEAVIGLSGTLKGPAGSESDASGKLDGLAVLDLSAGLISEVDARVSYFSTDGAAKTSGAIEITLRRAVR